MIKMIKESIKKTMDAHIKKYGATAFSSPCSLIHERGEDIRGIPEWDWVVEWCSDGIPLHLTENELHARMLEWCKNEEETIWDALTPTERNATTIQMYKEVYVDELIERITADWDL